MIYKGKQLSTESAKEFIDNNCIVNRQEDEYGIRIDITIKDSGEYVAGIKGELGICYSNFDNKGEMTFNITGLEVKKRYTRKGIGTLLMKEVIMYAENYNVKNIYVKPIATESIITQTNLEKFYRKFYNEYRFFCFKHHRHIRFY